MRNSIIILYKYWKDFVTENWEQIQRIFEMSERCVFSVAIFQIRSIKKAVES